MKKHSAEPLLKPYDPEPSNIPAKPHVRYLGFEGTEGGGRLLEFSVKTIGHEPVEITIEVSDAAFTGRYGISIQDAAPMAYEKIVELAKEHTLEPNELCLTESDIARYISRHLSSQKRANSGKDGRERSDAAA
jgi:hypothetical protein